MNTFDKIRSFCRPFRIIIGIVTITIGYFSTDGALTWTWWYLGVLPLVAGLANFCPLCLITKKCSK
jgi:hypothetical protein